MAQPSYMGGLLGAAQTPFNPTLPQGLLARMALPGQPAAAMAGNLMQMEGGSPQGAPAAAPAPAAPSTPIAPPPTASPTQLGLMTGGMAAMEAARPGNGGGSLGAALGAGLAAGSANFTAAKNEKADLATRRAKQEAFASQVMALPLPEEAKTGLVNMGYEAGAKLLAENGMAVNLEQTKQKAPTTLAEGAQLVSADGKVIAENVKPKVPFDIAKMTSDQRDGFALLFGRDMRDPEAFAAPLSKEEAKVYNAWQQAQTAARAPKTSVSVNNAGPEDGAKQVWKSAMDLATAEFDRVKGIPARLKVYDDIIAMTKGEQYLNGGLAETRLAVTKIGRMLGLPIGNMDKINSSDVILSKLKNAALQRLPELDSRPTDKDMEILIQAIGSTEMSPAALARIMADAKQAAVAEMGNWNRRRALQNDQFKTKGMAELPAYLEELPLPGAKPATDTFYRFPGAELIPRGGK